LILFIFLRNRDLFRFNSVFIIRFCKIIFSSILMGIFFEYVISIFENQLEYSFNFKSLYLILSVFLGLLFYLLLSLFIKAFKYEDIKLKY